MEFRIEADIFSHFPGMKIVVAVAHNLVVTEEAASQIRADLDNAWKHAGTEATARGNAQSHPYIVPWIEHMKGVGAPRRDFPSSIESLVRRAGKQGSPVSISPLVDFYNTVSLSNIVPAGGYDIDELQQGLSLRFSAQGDTFHALDEDTIMDVPPGEVSYADGKTITTRHFVWKQSKHALLKLKSKNVLFLAEVLGELPEEISLRVQDQFQKNIKRLFGITAKVDILDKDNPVISLT